jgi:hypothetical protein
MYSSVPKTGRKCNRKRPQNEAEAVAAAVAAEAQVVAATAAEEAKEAENQLDACRSAR